MERETWEALLSFLLAINDALLSPPTVKGNGARDSRWSPFSFKQCFESRFIGSRSRLCWILIFVLIPDWGFAASGSRLCWIRIQALLNPDSGLLNPDPGYVEAGSRLCWIRIQALLNPDPVFADSGFRLCLIYIQALLYPDPGFAESGSKLCWSGLGWIRIVPRLTSLSWESSPGLRVGRQAL